MAITASWEQLIVVRRSWEREEKMPTNALAGDGHRNGASASAPKTKMMDDGHLTQAPPDNDRGHGPEEGRQEMRGRPQGARAIK